MTAAPARLSFRELLEEVHRLSEQLVADLRQGGSPAGPPKAASPNLAPACGFLTAAVGALSGSHLCRCGPRRGKRTPLVLDLETPGRKRPQ